MDSRQYRDLMEAYVEVYASQEEINEADSLAAMQARREKRLAAQRKREGTTATGRDFGRDDSLSSAQQKARRDTEFKAGTKNEEFDLFDTILEFLYVEGYVDTLEEAEWMMANIIDEEAIDIILGEELTGERLKRAETKMKSLGRRKSTLPSREALSRVSIGKEGTGAQGGKKAPVKRGGGGTAGRAKVSGTGGDNMDRGYGNKAARRAAALKKEEFELWVESIEDILEIFVEEFIDEGYHEDDIFESFEESLEEATVTYGHDTDKPYQKDTSTRRLVKAVGRLARKTLKKKGAELKQKATAKYQEKKSGLKKGIRNVALKVADRMKEEFTGPCPECRQDLCECDLAEQFDILKSYLFENDIVNTEEDVLEVFENITDEELEYCLEQAMVQLKGKKKGNVVINPEVKKVNESEDQKKMQLQKKQLMINKQKIALQQKATSKKTPTDMHVEENLQEVDMSTRANDFGAEIERTNVRQKKEKKGLKDFKKLSMGGKTKTEEVEMEEGLKQARKNVGADKCWDGYKAKGTKMKDGKQVPDCQKEETIEEVELDERTRYAKETGKDPQTNRPSEKGGTMKGSVMSKVRKDLIKTGGLVSSRGKAIQPQGKKKEKGKKGYQGVTPVDRIKGKLARKRAPKPDIGSRFD